MVSVKHADGSSKPVKHQSWVQTLVSAMLTFFDCKSYSTGLFSSIEWTFYGIAENTIAAAMAFEMAYNVIVEWARPYKGVGTKNSYCIGAAEELDRMARNEKKDEEEKAKRAEFQTMKASVNQEEAQRREELKRLVPIPSDSDFTSSDPAVAADVARHCTSDDQSSCAPSPFPVLQVGVGNMFGYPESSKDEDEDEDQTFDHVTPDFKVEADDDNQVDLLIDINEEIMKRIKPEPTPSEYTFDEISATPEARTVEFIVKGGMKREQGEMEVHKSTWASSMQLTTLRATASRIADDYLKDKGIKLSRRTSNYSDIRDWTAYQQGTRDGKKIDVRRKRIEG